MNAAALCLMLQPLLPPNILAKEAILLVLAVHKCTTYITDPLRRTEKNETSTSCALGTGCINEAGGEQEGLVLERAHGSVSAFSSVFDFCVEKVQLPYSSAGCTTSHAVGA